MGERSRTMTMGAPWRSPMKRGKSMGGERSRHTPTTTHRNVTEKVNQHG